MERCLGARIDEKFSDFEKRISSIERGTKGAGHNRIGASPRCEWGPTPTNLKAVIHGFKPDAKEQEVKRIVAKVISDTGMKEEHIVDYPAIPTHPCLRGIRGHEDQRQIRPVGKHEEI